MATNIPPHNLSEIIDAAVLLIDKPDAPLKEIMKLVPGPGFSDRRIHRRPRGHPCRPTRPAAAAS